MLHTNAEKSYDTPSSRPISFPHSIPFPLFPHARIGQTPAMRTYQKAEGEVSGSAEQGDAAFTKEPVQVTTPAAAAGDAPSRAPLSSSKATTAGAGSAAPAKKKKEKSAKGPKADSMATGEAASAPYSDELDAPWSADSSATMMSSFFASSAALRQAMPQLQSKSKPISEVSALNECAPF